MDPYTAPTFYVVLGTFVAAGLAAYWTLVGLRREKSRLHRSEYHDHVKGLMQSVVDKTPTLSRGRDKEDEFGQSIIEHQLNENILQHFFSYQETDHVKIFELYKEHIKLGHGSRSVFNIIFYRYFSEIDTKSNSEFGVCDSCIDKFGFFEKRKYKKILNSLPKDT